jgi:ABC-type dipeptide/oligopeptide/nickel transport system permease component
MLQFLLKRLIGFFFVLLGVSLITFIIGYFTPIDPIRQLMGQHYTYQGWLQLRHVYGLDLPWYQQYYNFLLRFMHFDLGRSIHYQNRSVSDILKEGVPISAELSSWGLLLTLFLGIPAGILSAVKANTWIDGMTMITPWSSTRYQDLFSLFSHK